MRAICFHDFGGPERLHPDDLPRPKPGAGEVRIRVVAAGVNPVDWKIREGLLRDLLPHELPIVPGWDAAGLIEELGPGADRFRRGQRVWTYARKPVVRGGTYAEYVVVPETSVGAMPSGILYEEAAAVPLVGLTASQALLGVADLQAGETVLVVGGSGGVGHLAVQIAKDAGATVLASAGPNNQGFLSEAGARYPIDYSRDDLVDAVRRIAPRGADVVLDCVGGDTGRDALAATRDGGRFVSIVDSPDPASTADRGIRASFHFVEPDGPGLDRLKQMIESERLNVYVEKIHPLAEAAEAQRASQAGHVRGKRVLAL